ncbi:MAG: ACT domain-containing protein [Proteobacteria bacterium]|nr:ACT domain-containing protein [Pseudomonadota bacterium]
MVAAMNPVLAPGAWVFVTLPDAAPELLAAALATFREDEGLTLVLPQGLAEAAGLAADMPMARIVLTVHSALDGVGLTAAVAAVLAAEGIACNVIAAFHHDHLFVPEIRAEAALAALRRAQQQAGAAP